MTVSSYCLSASRKSRIPGNIKDNCAKYRSGSCDACERLARIDRQIEETRRVLTRLLDEREGLTSIINGHHDPFSNRLPVELVSRVLELSLPTFKEDIDCPSLPAATWIKSVQLLSSICRSWRAIALNTPQLWNVLPIALTTKKCISSIAMVQQWLERSANLPLYVQLYDFYTTDDVIAFTNELISNITPSAHRWKVLDVILPPSLLRFLLKSLSNQSLLLNDLKCYVKKGGDCVGGFEVFTFNASPRTLEQDCDPSGLYKISVKMDRLTSFVSHHGIVMHVEDCVHLFEGATRLSSCKIACIQGSRITGPLVRASSLRTLYINSMDAVGFWDHFEFPQLEDVALGHAPNTWSGLPALIRRSGCGIKQLNLYFEEDTRSHEIMELFKLVPGLQRLHFISSDSIRPLRPLTSMMSAAASESSSGFLGKLASLECSVCDDLFDWNPLLLFLTAMRSRPAPTLEAFKFFLQIYRPGRPPEEAHVF